MTAYEMLSEKALELVGSASNQRMRPSDVKRALAKEFGISASKVNEVVKELVDDEELVYSYRDPCSYVEIPCNGCDGAYRAARPMGVVMDRDGNPWLCDDGLDPSNPTTSASCWECGSVAFTRSD